MYGTTLVFARWFPFALEWLDVCTEMFV